MAQKIQVLLMDDIDGSEATETVHFSLNGVSYEIDLNDKNAMTLRSSLAPYIGNARRERARRRRGGTTSTKHADTTTVRAWARQHGHKVNDRGRISAAVYEAYHAAHA
jgi:hypothetical protein